MKRFALDWFEAGFDEFQNPVNIASFLNDIFHSGCHLEDGGSSRFYDCSFKCASFVFQYGLKPGLKNKKCYLKLFGTFFQSIHWEDSLNYFLEYAREMGIGLKISRVDACIDLISGVGYGLERWVTPIPIHKNTTLKTIESEGNGIETFFSGCSDFRFRCYNKLLENEEYAECYGLELMPAEVQRIEAQVRGELMNKIAGTRTIDNCYQLMHEVLGQIGRRFAIDGLILPKSNVTTTRQKPVQLVNRVNYAKNKLDKALEAYEKLLKELESDVY